MNVRIIPGLAVSCLVLAGCGDDGATGPDAPTPAAIEVVPGAVTLTAIGDDADLAAGVRDADGALLPEAAVTWSALDEAVATVTAADFAPAIATVVAAAPGEARIRAAAGSVADTVVVTVSPAVAAVDVRPVVEELHAIGDSTRLEAVAHDRNGHAIEVAAIEWTSLDEAVATVDSTGRVAAVANGTARIRAAVGDASDEAVVQVRQVPATVAVSPAADTLAPGGTVQLTATVADSNGVAIPDAGPVWTSSDASVAAVDAGGRVTAAWGDAAVTITAAAGGATGAAELTVLGQIAFTNNRTGAAHLYVMNSDGTDTRRLTWDLDQTQAPAWSADGTRIAFVGIAGGVRDVYMMNSDGTGLVNLTRDADEAYNPTWSPDGGRIAYQAGAGLNGEIYVIGTDGTDKTNVTNRSGLDGDPDWSPDGAKLLFVSDRGSPTGLYTMNPDGTGVVRISGGTRSHHQPAWSPDGARIAFFQDFRIWVMNADGSGAAQATAPDDTDEFAPDWSPDGRRLVFQRYRDFSHDVMVIDVDGTDRTWLTELASSGAPAWRPRPKP